MREERIMFKCYVEILTFRIVSNHKINTRPWKLREFNDEHSMSYLQWFRTYIPEKKIYTNGKLQVNDLLQLDYTSCAVFSTPASQIELM